MLICSDCPKEFVQGQVCEDCSKLLCIDHKLDSCIFCGGQLKYVKNEVEKIGKLDINWLIIDGKRQLGVAGLGFLPAYAMKIWLNVRFSNSQLRVILFDSKERSI
jgi:hypothetical protein